MLFLSEGCPSIVRADFGTENTTLAATHMALRHEHSDDFSGTRSFRFGSSTTNTVGVALLHIYCNIYINCRGLRVGGHNFENLLLTGGLMFLRLSIYCYSTLLGDNFIGPGPRGTF